jgi:hypothetical protein
VPIWGHNGVLFLGFNLFMSFNLRLPPALDAAARARADAVGISLNAFVCVALSAYLEAPPTPLKSKKALKLVKSQQKDLPL